MATDPTVTRVVVCVDCDGQKSVFSGDAVHRYQIHQLAGHPSKHDLHIIYDSDKDTPAGLPPGVVAHETGNGRICLSRMDTEEYRVLDSIFTRLDASGKAISPAMAATQGDTP